MRKPLPTSTGKRPVWDTGPSPRANRLFRNQFVRLFALMLSLMSWNMATAQTSLTIGTGTTTTSYFPIYTCYGYNYSQQTFLASEIVAAGATSGTPGFISSISFNPTSIIASSFAAYCKDWVVYLGNTSKTTFSSTSDWVPLSSLTKVFDGTVSPTGTGWFKITFPTPFYWDGTSNLVVGIDENTSNYYCTASWQATSRSGTRAILYYSDVTNPNPSSPPSANLTSSATCNIKIDYTPAVACTGTPVGGSATASATTLCPGANTSLSVTGATGATGLTYQWQSSTASTGPWTDISGATGNSHTVAPPTGTTTYYRRSITCTASAATDYSTPVAVAVSAVATVPYSETFEGLAKGVNATCAAVTGTWDGAWSSYYGYNWTLMNSVTSGYTGSNHTPGGSNYIQTGYYIGTYSGYGAEYWFTPGIELSTGKTYRFSYWYRVGDYMASYYPAGSQFGMYYNTTQSKTGLVAIKGDLTPEANATYKQNVGDFSVSANGVYFLAVKVDNKGYAYYGGGVIDDINLIELPACNTATASTFGRGGTASASPNVICSVPGSTSLSVTGTPPFSGLSFQWEMSSGTPTSFSSVTGATAATSSYSVTAPGTYYFRCKVTCAATGLTTYSDTTKVTTTPITPPYIEDFETGVPGTNMPCAGSTYWGSAPTYWNIAGAPYDPTYAPGIRNHTTGGSKYLHAGYYLGYGTGTPHYWFTPGLALTAGKAYNVSYWYSNSGYFPTSYASYATEMGIYAGTAQTAAAMTIGTGPDTTIYINALGTPTYDKYVRGFIAPTTGTYFVGIKVNHKNYCYYGFAIDDIGVDQIPPCSAKPSAGTATASPSLICSSGTSTVSLVGISLASDLSFQWQTSTTAAPGSWTDISGATLPAYTTPVLTSGPVYYRCVVICNAIAAPNADTSAPAKISVGALDLPYVETFESGVDGVNMPCAGVAGTWSSSINYWYMRSGAYSTSYPGVNNHTPGGKRYIYSGYYNGPYYSTGDQFYWFTPALKMTSGKAYSVGFWYNGTGYSTGTNGLKLGIYAGTTQSAAGMTLRAGGVDSVVDATTSTYAQMTRSFVAPTTGSYYVGIKTVHTGYNYPGIPLDDININEMPDCIGKPVAGTPDASPALICTSGTSRLALTGTSVASGITYQWQISTAGPTGPFSNATGTSATWGTYTTPTLTATRWFRCIVKCTVSGLSDTSSVEVVNVGAITPPYYEDFEKVAPGTNAPCASYTSSWGTATSTTYWTTKGFNYTAYGTVHTNHTPGGSNYLWAGYYFGYSPSAGATWFTPAIKLTKDSSYQFSFWYMGPGYYYYNSGTEFNVRYGTAQTEAAMTNIVRGLWTDKRSNYRQFVGNFKAVATGNYYVGIKVRHTYSTYSYYGTSIDDIALEQLAPCSGVPTAGSIWAKPMNLCSSGTTVLDMDLSETSKASGLTYRWEYTTSDPTSGSFVPTGSSSVLTDPTFTTPILSQTTWFRCVVKCSYTGDSTFSDVTKVDVSVVTPPYIQTFETVDQGSNAPCASNTGTFSSSSFIYWNVLRVPISTSYAAIDNHTPKGTAYLMAGYYTGTYYASAQWWFTPKVRLTGGKMYYFSYWYSGSGYSGGKTDLAAAYGTTNTAAGMTTTIGTPLTAVNTYVWKKYDGRFTPTATGDYYVGIKVNHTTYCYPGIAIDDIGLQEVPPCSSTVVAGTITSIPDHICSAGGTAVLDLDGSTLATGLTYEWLSAPSATGPFSTTGGTGLPYTTDPLSATTYFKCVVTCTASGKSDTTAAFKVGVGGRDLPYIEDFETTTPGTKPLCSEATAWGTYYYDAWNVYAGTYTGSYTNHTPGGKLHLIAGYYLGWTTYSPSYTTVTDDNFWFTPGLNLRSGYKYKLNFWYVGASGGYVNQMGVYFGKSQSVSAMTGTIFPLRHVNNSAYVNIDTAFTVPTSGVYYVGFKKTTNRTYNYYGVAFDDINLNYAPCDGAPTAGVISGTVPSGTSKCKYTFVKLTDVGATVSLVPGIKYQWYRRDLAVPSATWKTVAGATDTVLASDTLIGYEYKLAVVCRNTNDTVYSAAYQLPQLTPHPSVSITPSTTPITFCVGDTVKFNATNFTSGVYDWMRDSVVVPGWKFSDMGAVDPGTYMVKVTSPLSPCPAYSNQVKLIANDPGYTVSITLPADSVLCAGSSVLLTAVASKPGVTFQWRKDNVAIPGATGSTYLVTTGGYYRVMASDGVSSCAAASRNIPMIVKPNPPAVITVPGGTTTACENEGVLLQASLGGYTYEWMRGGTPIYGLVDSAILVKNSGTYTVKVRNADGCASYSSGITVNILPSPTPVIVRTGDTLSTTVSYPFYQWIRNGVDIPGATGAKYVMTLKGFYKVRVTGTNNCDGESTPIEAMDNWLSIDNSSVASSEIKVFPNPTSGKVNIESPMPVQVQVKDLSGRVVVQGRETKEVDLSKLADGVYLFVILDKDGTQQISQQRVTKISANK